MNEFVNWLERELVDAARRQERRRRPGPRRYADIVVGARRRSGALVAAAGAAGAIVVAVGALILIGGHVRPHSSAAASSRQQLIDILAVLRRPQTKQDLRLPAITGVQHPGQGTPDLPLARLATITSWGEKVFFIPLQPPHTEVGPGPRTAAGRAAAAARARLPKALRVIPHGETLAVATRDGFQSGGTPADIEAGRGPVLFAPYLRASGRQGRTGAGQIIMVIPDGVTRVEFVLPRQPNPYGPVYPHVAEVSVAVKGNVAAFQLHRDCCAPAPPPMIWYGPDGHVIKRIGDFATLNRVIEPPKPGPQTPLSRAAERNPSTPNAVWAVTRNRGQSTSIDVHFRVLIDNAVFRIAVSGPNRRGCTGAGALSAGGFVSGLNLVRGQVATHTLAPLPPDRRLCPGRYRVDASVWQTGARVLRPAPAPFGSTTFTTTP